MNKHFVCLIYRTHLVHNKIRAKRKRRAENEITKTNMYDYIVEQTGNKQLEKSQHTLNAVELFICFVVLLRLLRPIHISHSCFPFIVFCSLCKLQLYYPVKRIVIICRKSLVTVILSLRHLFLFYLIVSYITQVHDVVEASVATDGKEKRLRNKGGFLF